MADVFSREKRSEVMSKIKGRNTKPEILVRKFLFSKGLRFRIHQKTLVGKPDIVLKKYNCIIFIHGCFWHGHRNCKYFKLPKQNRKFWKEKIINNIRKDQLHKRELKKGGWQIITIWECSLKPSKQEKTLKQLLKSIIN